MGTCGATILLAIALAPQLFSNGCVDALTIIFKRFFQSEEFEIGGAKIVFLPKIDVFGKTVLLAPLVMGRSKLELHRVEEASGYQIHANTEPEGCRKVKSEEFEIGGAKIVFLPKIDVFGKTVLLAPLVMGRPQLELYRVEEASGYQVHVNTEPERCRKVKSEEFEIGGAKIVFICQKLMFLVKPFCWHPWSWGARS